MDQFEHNVEESTRQTWVKIVILRRSLPVYSNSVLYVIMIRVQVFRSVILLANSKQRWQQQNKIAYYTVYSAAVLLQRRFGCRIFQAPLKVAREVITGNRLEY